MLTQPFSVHLQVDILPSTEEITNRGDRGWGGGGGGGGNPPMKGGDLLMFKNVYKFFLKKLKIFFYNF